MTILEEILKTGKIPDVPLKVEVDNNSVIKLAVAAVLVAVVITLFVTILKKVK